ncbi:hypothetical protein U9M48_031256 [Paspalum notatum var. saurae]|uniref:Uncharacterized protein n=1 Tax=Paspalum notatum var. saurae TaxID=547442 RepID=A0AAQ3X469_PASNO
MKTIEDPIVAYLALYLHALDDEYDKLTLMYRKLEARYRASESLLTTCQQQLARRENEFNPQCPSCIHNLRTPLEGMTCPPTQPSQSPLGSVQFSLLEQWKAREQSLVSHLSREDKGSMGAFLTLSSLGEGSSSQQPSQNEASIKLKPVQLE